MKFGRRDYHLATRYRFVQRRYLPAKCLTFSCRALRKSSRSRKDKNAQSPSQQPFNLQCKHSRNNAENCKQLDGIILGQGFLASSHEFCFFFAIMCVCSAHTLAASEWHFYLFLVCSHLSSREISSRMGRACGGPIAFSKKARPLLNGPILNDCLNDCLARPTETINSN